MIKCWRYRRIISRSADENAPLPPAAQAHVAQCQDCRRIYETEHQIVRRLSAGAAAQKWRQPAPFLHARIMARIAASERRLRAAGPSPHLRRPLLLATACMVLATILLWPGRPGPKPSPGQIVLVQPPRTVQTAPQMDWADTTLLTQWATNLDKPLQTEMQAVFHDARGAVTALADNFFPEKLRQTLLDETSSRN
jgi:hypothetical protein